MIWPHEPKAGVRLRIKINNQNLLFVKLSQSGPEIDNTRSFTDSALEINKSKNLRAHQPTRITLRKPYFDQVLSWNSGLLKVKKRLFFG